MKTKSLLTDISFLVFVASTMLISCAPKTSNSPDAGFVNPTIYFKPTVSSSKLTCGANELEDLKDDNGKTLVTLCPKEFKQCLLQGSCFISDGTTTRSFNISNKVDGTYRFKEVSTAKCPYGFGVSNICLDPYFSVAADLTIFEAGDVLFFPKLVNLRLPNGQVHNGYVIVRDSGDKIKGAHRLDFFTGLYDHLAKQNTLATLGFGDPKNTIEFRRVRGVEAERIRSARNYPGLP